MQGWKQLLATTASWNNREGIKPAVFALFSSLFTLQGEAGHWGNCFSVRDGGICIGQVTFTAVCFETSPFGSRSLKLLWDQKYGIMRYGLCLAFLSAEKMHWLHAAVSFLIGEKRDAGLYSVWKRRKGKKKPTKTLLCVYATWNFNCLGKSNEHLAVKTW